MQTEKSILTGLLNKLLHECAENPFDRLRSISTPNIIPIAFAEIKYLSDCLK